MMLSEMMARKLPITNNRMALFSVRPDMNACLNIPIPVNEVPF
jgi:hypothetical protein